jgi:MarR family transcriptional regulator, negative regulator of the multidrug operon emrRAB
MQRLTNLLGVTALAAMDRLRPAVEILAGHGGSAPAVLAHLLAHPGDSVEGLRGVLSISQPATVRLVDRLVADGFLERRPGPDRRTLALVLTPAGRETATQLLAARADALADMLAVLDEQEASQLEALLAKLTVPLAVDRPGALTVCRLCDRAACAQEPGCPLNHTVGDPGP